MDGASPGERSRLKGLAHGLKPVAQVGKYGLTEAVVRDVGRALDDHELIKVRFIAHKEERRQLSEALAGATGSELVDLIGNTAILYRQASEPEKRRIGLPGS